MEELISALNSTKDSMPGPDLIYTQFLKKGP